MFVLNWNLMTLGRVSLITWLVRKSRLRSLNAVLPYLCGARNFSPLYDASFSAASGNFLVKLHPDTRFPQGIESVVL